jgi:hypothetical protein
MHILVAGKQSVAGKQVSNSMVVVVMGSWWRWHFMVNHGGDSSPDELAPWSV